MEYSFFALRIVLNPFVNLFQKKLSAKGVSSLHLVLVTYIFCSLISVPVLFMRGVSVYTPELLVWTASMSLVGTAGNALLVLALSKCDLSIFGPINSFKPVIGLALGLLVLREIPSAQAFAGVAVIVAGSALLSFRKGGGGIASSVRALFRSHGVMLRIASLTLISIEAVLMKKVLGLSDPLLAFALWSVTGVPFLVAACRMLRPGLSLRTLSLLRSNPLHAAGAVALYGAMQCVTFVVFSGAIVGISLALFQLSSLVSVVLGWKYFGEKDIVQRLAGAAVMMIGAALILV